MEPSPAPSLPEEPAASSSPPRTAHRIAAWLVGFLLLFCLFAALAVYVELRILRVSEGLQLQQTAADGPLQQFAEALSQERRKHRTLADQLKTLTISVEEQAATLSALEKHSSSAETNEALEKEISDLRSKFTALEASIAQQQSATTKYAHALSAATRLQPTIGTNDAADRAKQLEERLSAIDIAPEALAARARIARDLTNFTTLIRAHEIPTRTALMETLQLALSESDSDTKPSTSQDTKSQPHGFWQRLSEGFKAHVRVEAEATSAERRLRMVLQGALRRDDLEDAVRALSRAKSIPPTLKTWHDQALRYTRADALAQRIVSALATLAQAED